MECRYCNTVFTKKSNLKRHMLRQHDSKSIHHHGLQYVDKRFVTGETACFLHEGVIRDGKMFHCFVCNFSICTDCMEEDCRYCKRDICTHKNILIIINYKVVMELVPLLNQKSEFECLLVLQMSNY